MMADEIQCGLGRTGRMLCVDWEDVKPDVVLLGKSLSGGFMPVSAVLANDNVMKVWSYGDHMSTYAANPLGMALTKAAIEVLLEEKLTENAERLGNILAEEMNKWKYDFVKDIQCGKGLFASVQFDEESTAWAIGKYILDKGVLARTQFGNRLKIMPPLCISEEDLRQGLKIFKDGMEEYKKNGEKMASG